MKRFIASAAAAAALSGSASAQFPALAGGTSPTSVFPGGVAPPPGVPGGIAPQVAGPDGPTLWSKLGLSKAQMEACRREMCGKPIGKVLGTVISPMSKLTGGLIPGFCPTTPTLAELLDPGPIGAAAKVKQDRASAEARAAAIEYLGSVDCHYWPEAEDALINALRNDRNECVRYKAALTLGKGCCCTCKVIVALSHSVSCSDKDGAPWEKSARVRSAAAVALEKCMQSACCPVDLPVDDPKLKEKEKEKEKGEDTEKEKKTGANVNNAAYMAPATAKPGPNTRDPNEPMTMREYYAAVPRVPRNTILTNAKNALDVGRRIGFTPTEEVNATDYAAAGNAVVAKKPHNLIDAIYGADDAGMAPQNRPSAPPAPVAATVTRTAVPVETHFMKPAPKAPVPVPTPAKIIPAVTVSKPTAPKPAPVVMPTAKAKPAPTTPGPVNAAPVERIAPPATVAPLPVYGAPAGQPSMDPVPVTPSGRPTQYGPVYNPYGLR